MPDKYFSENTAPYNFLILRYVQKHDMACYYTKNKKPEEKQTLKNLRGQMKLPYYNNTAIFQKRNAIWTISIVKDNIK